MVQTYLYCKFGNFRENFMCAKSVKKHICYSQNLQLGHSLPISVIYTSRGFNFHETAKFRENKTLAKISEFTVHLNYLSYLVLILTYLNWSEKGVCVHKRAMTRDFQQCGMCDQQSLRSACAYAQSDQSLCLLLVA